MKYVLILSRGGKEKERLPFNANDTTEAITTAMGLAKAEWKERQAEFPYTQEHAPDAVLLCEVWSLNGKDFVSQKKQ